MPVLKQQDTEAVRKRFGAELKRDVGLTLYTQKSLGGLFIPGRECRSCGPTQQMLEEVVALSPKLSLEVVDYYANEADATSRGIDRIPATVISGEGHGDRVRYYGMPSGFEFAVLLDSIIAASTARRPLQMKTRRALKEINQDVHIQVFVTPAGQDCPAVARVAHDMAMESSRVVADVVEIQEYPRLAQAYGVRGVPTTVINDSVQFTGAVTEDVFVGRILEAVGDAAPAGLGENDVTGQVTPIASA